MNRIWNAIRGILKSIGSVDMIRDRMMDGDNSIEITRLGDGI